MGDHTYPLAMPNFRAWFGFQRKVAQTTWPSISTLLSSFPVKGLMGEGRLLSTGNIKESDQEEAVLLASLWGRAWKGRGRFHLNTGET